MDSWMGWLSLPRIGLLYDIFGVVVLALGLLLIGPRDFRNANLAFPGKSEIEKLGYAKVDAYFGVSLIVLGFFGQLLGSDDCINAIFRNTGTTGPIVLIILLGLVLVAFFLFRGRLAEREISRSGVKD